MKKIDWILEEIGYERPLDEVSEIVDSIIGFLNKNELKLLEIVDSSGNISPFRDQLVDTLSSRYPADIPREEVQKYLSNLIQELHPHFNKYNSDYIKEFLIYELNKSIFVSKKTSLFNQDEKIRDGNQNNKYVEKIIKKVIKKIPDSVLNLLENEQTISFQNQLLLRYSDSYLRFSKDNIEELTWKFSIKNEHIFQRIQSNKKASQLDKQAILSYLDNYFSKSEDQCDDIWFNDWLLPESYKPRISEPNKNISIIFFKARKFPTKTKIFSFKSTDKKEQLIATIYSCLSDINHFNSPKIKSQLSMQFFHKIPRISELAIVRTKTKEILKDYAFLLDLSNTCGVRNFIIEKINSEIFTTRSLRFLNKKIPYKWNHQEEPAKNIKKLLKLIFLNKTNKRFLFLSDQATTLNIDRMIFFDGDKTDNELFKIQAELMMDKFLLSKNIFFKKTFNRAPIQQEINLLIKDFLSFSASEDFTTCKLFRPGKKSQYFMIFVAFTTLIVLIATHLA